MTAAELDRLVPPDDFRRAAVEASLDAVRGEDRDDNPPPGDCSVCLPVRGANSDSLKPLLWRQVAVLVVGFAGLSGGAGLAYLSGEPPNGQWPLLVAGLCLSATGMAALLSNQYFLRRFFRGRLGRRYETLRADFPDAHVQDVLIEDAATFHKGKLHAEGGGYVAVDLPGKRAIVEGVRFRYLIRAADTVAVGIAAGLTATSPTVRYRCGPRPAAGEHDPRPILAIALARDSLWRELKRQTFFGAGTDPLLKPLLEALDPVNESTDPFVAEEQWEYLDEYLDEID